MARPDTDGDSKGRRDAGLFVNVRILLLLFALLPFAGERAAATSVMLSDAQLHGSDVVNLFRTVQSDFFAESDGTTYVQTGDIPAMWLRDSSGQARPYVRFATFAPRLDQAIRGVIARNAKNILTDSYANAFTAGYKVWEEKWEVDSLANAIRLASVYWHTTGNRAIFTPRLHWSLDHALRTYECEQRHAACSSYRTRFLPNSGSGEPYAYTGMIWGAFRSSDDPVRYAYNIPQQIFAASSLDDLAELETVGYHDTRAARRAQTLAEEVREGVQRYGSVVDMRYGRIYAYEVDGLGDYELMDDANAPSLLSLPIIDSSFATDGTYIATRAWVLSSNNPYYYSGRYAQGEGSPHTPTGWVWPMGLIIQGLTERSPDETRRMLGELDAIRGCDCGNHESVDPNDPSRFTRSSFGWVDALDAELRFRTFGGLAPQPGSGPTPVLNSPYETWLYAAQVSRAAEMLPMDQ